MAEKLFKVLREHVGDKSYMPGDTRTAEENDVRHLVPNTLVEIPAENPVKETKAENPVKETKGK